MTGKRRKPVISAMPDFLYFLASYPLNIWMVREPTRMSPVITFTIRWLLQGIRFHQKTYTFHEDSNKTNHLNMWSFRKKKLFKYEFNSESLLKMLLQAETALLESISLKMFRSVPFKSCSCISMLLLAAAGSSILPAGGKILPRTSMLRAGPVRSAGTSPKSAQNFWWRETDKNLVNKSAVFKSVGTNPTQLLARLNTIWRKLTLTRWVFRM